MIKLLEKSKVVGKKNNLSPFYSLIVFSFILLIGACSKPAGLIGVVVQPEDSRLGVGYADTAFIYAYSIPEDSVRTDELSFNLIGSNMDPVFGNTQAGVYLQYMLENADHDYGPNAVVDSLVMNFLYSTYYGDTTTMQVLRAYEMEEKLYVDSAYYSNLEVPVNPTDYANFEFTPRPLTDTLIIGGDTLPSMLRVNLMNNPGLAEKLITAPKEAMASNEAFQEFFKGMHFITDPVTEGGAIVSYDIFSNYSEMIMYYHNDLQDSLKFDYMVALINATANKYVHNFESGEYNFKTQVQDGDTSLGAQNVYLQGIGGVATIVRIPNMASWRELGPVAINEAKLILTGTESDPLWGAPPKLSMAQIKEDGSFDYLDDQIEELEVYFGGEYNPSTNSYTFRITRYIQDLISDPEKVDYGLYLIPTGASIFPNRFVFNGYDPVTDTATRLKLEILYTDLD